MLGSLRTSQFYCTKVSSIVLYQVVNYWLNCQGLPRGYTPGSLLGVRIPVTGARCPEPNDRCLVPSVWRQVSGVECLVPSAQCLVSGIWCPVPSARCHSPVSGVQCLVSSLWFPVPSVWCSVFGVRCPVPHPGRPS